MGFDRLTGIEIADLADRLMEVWPDERGEDGDVAAARDHVEALDRSVERIAQIVIELRAELQRLERDGGGGGRRSVGGA